MDISAVSEEQFSGESLNEDGELLIREAELHELVTLHAQLDSLLDAIENEFDFRISTLQKVSAGDDADRSYAEENRIS